MSALKTPAVALAIAVSTTTLAQDRQGSAGAIAATIERELKAARIPGASFAVLSGADVLAGSYGLADAERGVAMTPDTLLQVGSLNKLTTALALLSTLDAHEIALNESVGRYVPGLSAHLAKVSFHELLSQTSGLRDHAGVSGTNDEGALAARVRAITESDFVLPAGTVFSYSNLGYATAGMALEHLRKKPFADALREALLEPLGLRSTTMRPTEARQQPHAVGHRLEQSATIAIRDADNDTSIWPAGYLWSSARDLSKLFSLLLGSNDKPLDIARVAFTRATTPQTPMPNVFAGGHYGYGLMLATDRGTRIYEHGGTQRGFSSILRIAPDRRFGIIILTNLDNAPLRRLAQLVMAEALQLPADVPAPRVETKVSPDEISSFVGVYRNRGTAEIAVRDGRVMLILDGGAPMEVTRIAPHRYLARPKPDIAGPEFVLQPTTPTTPAYLHFALWAYTR